MSEVPPIETAHWLLKPAGHIRGTWRNPQGASAWLGVRLVEYAPRFSGRRQQSAAWIADTVTSAAERLTGGCDVSLGFYLGHPLFLSLALVTCSPNRASPELLCPAGLAGR
ncbi:hypothetical protein [Streptomyces sp. NBC_00878]|uniref:hypothetical protein n=1 Tax=Streptomyces sp. NBC_00878 TaxID=2975854 RepID=UPI0022513E49|nr:hypothetical protein [Streptomyces sp. NBC_00878]MCX4906625.1 hypothetical protein [Streptomyces sp. NBC_00878]